LCGLFIERKAGAQKSLVNALRYCGFITVHDPISAPTRPRGRFLWVLLALVVVMVLVFIVGNWQLSEYALTPGNATPVAPLVKIRGVATDPHNDKIMLVDVYLSNLNVFQWARLHFESHVQFVPASELVDPGIPDGELGPQGFQEMNDSKQAAEVAAFRALGWKVPSVATGTNITGVVSPSPAYTAGLHVADQIVAVDGQAVRSACGLIKLMHNIKPNTLVHLSVQRAQITRAGDISLRKANTVNITTATPPSYLGSTGCADVNGPSRSWLGITVENGDSYVLPAKVSVNTANIGGPSAGLAMTLTIIDKLSAGSLTGHRVIAATGTMATNGVVGDVGGVAEKTVAVQRAGASIFFVPDVEVATARSVAGPGLKIVGVRSLSQVLSDLHRLGGASPKPLTKPH
jgi:PDZ domain-containing protein